MNENEIPGLVALAKGYLTIGRIRELSWNKQTLSYGLTFSGAAKQSGLAPQITSLVEIMLISGYGDCYDWACMIIVRYEPNWPEFPPHEKEHGLRMINSYYPEWKA